jgi:UDPglucose 6-dehydrogenase/UDP-N-acetyl-D-galactosamine dehydrogenase
VIEAAATKWNFQKYTPGLVGGHCIPVDPYYLTHKAKQLGYHPKVTLAGRSVNDSMPKYIADTTIKTLLDTRRFLKSCKALIMGLTYKENIADTRETPATEIIKKLKAYGIEVYGYDPYIKEDTRKDFNIEFIDSIGDQEIKFDTVIITVAHEAFMKLKLIDLVRIQTMNPIIIDIRRLYDQEEAEKMGFIYRTL